MHKALIYASRQGPFKKEITAFDIKSREHYRDLLPLLCPETGKPVTWVKGNFEDRKVIRRSHFRLLAGKRRSDYLNYTEYKKSRNASIQTPEHIKAKEVLFEVLSRELSGTKRMFWQFSYGDISAFYFKGNMLFNATEVKMECHVKTLFNKDVFLDLAIVGQSFDNEPLILFGIELEKEHQFGGLKTILCKALGFPFISIDISDMAIDDINLEWAKNALSLTTKDDPMGFRKSFVYLPPLLYPFYVRYGDIRLDLKGKQVYIVFASDDKLTTIRDEVTNIRDKLGYDKESLNISIVNGHKSPEALRQVESAGKIIGEGWSQLNSHQYLRISVSRPIGNEKINALHRFYLLMANSLLNNNALVGYKYSTGGISSQPNEDDDIWTVYQIFPGEKKKSIPHRFLPKLLSSPLLEAAKIIGFS